MLREYGLEPSRTESEPGGQTYSEMAEALIELAVPEREAVDLLVLAHAIPDINPGRNATAQLSARCPGTPLAFGLTDQGAAAPFTALRLIREYARTGGLRRALLLVLEQAELPYDTGVPAARPDGHSGVALLLGEASDSSPSAASIRLGTVVTRAGCRDEDFADELSILCTDAAPVTVILGAALADQPIAPTGIDRLRTAAAGRPYTGLWWELADELSKTDSTDNTDNTPRRIVLCDYDPVQSCLCLAALDVGQLHERWTTLKDAAPDSAIAA
jgi:4-hydroxymandelate oxidase